MFRCSQRNIRYFTLSSRITSRNLFCRINRSLIHNRHSLCKLLNRDQRSYGKSSGHFFQYCCGTGVKRLLLILRSNLPGSIKVLMESLNCFCYLHLLFRMILLILYLLEICRVYILLIEDLFIKRVHGIKYSFSSNAHKARQTIWKSVLSV